MVHSISMSLFAKVVICFASLFALANCRYFEDDVHNRGLKTIEYCLSYQTGTDWYGNDINTTPMTHLRSAYSCCTECNRLYGESSANVVGSMDCHTCVRVGVRSYIYRTDFSHCYCKYAAANRRPCPVCQGSNNTVTDPPHNCPMQNGVDSFGYDLRGPYEGVTRAEDCCANCYNYGHRCVAWVWRRDFNRCYLKSGTVPFTSCPQCVFGRRY